MTTQVRRNLVQPRPLDLGGAWSLRSTDGRHRLTGNVPGCVHTDLLAAGLLPDPLYRMNEHDVQWVGKTDWVYEREFEADDDWLACQRVVLEFDGLDTFAEVRVNGERVGESSNMFRTWRYDVRGALLRGTNVIQVSFASCVNRSLSKMQSDPIPFVAWDLPDARGRAWVRKQQSQFGWDWGPMLATAGIFRPVRLLAADQPRIDHVGVRQQHTASGVTLRISAPLAGGVASTVRAVVALTLDGQTVASAETYGDQGVIHAELDIDAPRLWWPRGMGGQPLYKLTVDAYDEQGVRVSTATRRIGLRHFTLDRSPDAWGESFAFRINGRRFFAKGANWIPADVFPSRVDPQKVRDLLAGAADANMNTIRVWGGGLYETEDFYDACDELGLCVWQDFMFACAPYPTHDADFMDNVRQEAIEVVRRLNHRACVCLWCGNNELEWLNTAETAGDGRMAWKDYLPLFDGVLKDVCATYAGDTPYWPCSPHKTIGDRADVMDERSGDHHTWGVWHQGHDIDWYLTTAPRFVSEFGFQSFPEPRSMRAVIDASAGDDNLTSEAVDHRQRSGAGTGRILHDLARWYRMPRDFDHTLWLTQVLQAQCVKTAVEHWRRGAPRTMGAIYWQLNDLWTGPSWSSIDVQGRWKALHYVVRRCFAPRLLSVKPSPDGLLEVFLSHEEPEPVIGDLRWTLTHLDGRVIGDGLVPSVRSQADQPLLHTLDCRAEVAAHGAGDVAAWLSLTPRAGEPLSAEAFFRRPKHLKLDDPRLRVTRCEQAGRTWSVTLRADRCALWTWLTHPTLDLRCSDNFFHLRAGEERTIRVELPRGAEQVGLEAGLEAKSLFDTFSR